MGEVYRARDTRLDRTVAIKLLPSDLVGDPERRARFEREAKTIAGLNHPHICTLHDVGEHEGSTYLVMEHLTGETLAQRLGKGPLPFEQALTVATEIAEALAAAHRQHIVHRDLKPGNIMLVKAGGALHAKLLDFGLAKLQAPAAKTSVGFSSLPTQEPMTSPGAVMGTVRYMAPEQLEGKETDARTDLFAFGCVLYEMLTGRRTFAGETEASIIAAIMSSEPPSIRSVQPLTPPTLDRLVRRCLAKDPDARWQTAADVTEELRGISADSVPPSARWRDRPRRRRTRMLTASVVVLVLGAVAFLTEAWRLMMPFADYDPCVVVGTIKSNVDTVEGGIAEFVLKRALTQDPNLLVYDENEYGVALRLEKSGLGSTPTRLARWMPTPRELVRRAPAVRVSAEVTSSLGNLAVNLRVVDRGTTNSSVLRYHDAGEFLTDGIDAITRTAVDRYRRQGVMPASPGNQAYRPVRTLLSDHLDAIRHFWRAREAWSHLDITLAEHGARQTLEVDPRFALAHLLLAEIRVFENQWDGARAEIAQVQALPAALTDSDTLRLNALLARASGNAPEERKWLQKLIGLRPNRKEFVYELAESYFHTADVDDARRRYEEALRIDDKYALAYNHLGYCYSWQGQHDRALQQFNRYLRLDGSANAYDSLGDAYMNAGQYARAAEAKEKALMMDATLYFARRSLASIAALTGRYTAAERALGGMMKGNVTERTWSLARLAFFRLQIGDLDAASRACSQGLALLGAHRSDAPADELLWLQGQIELKRGDLAAAHAALAALTHIEQVGAVTETNYKPAYKFAVHLTALVKTAEGRRGEALAALDDLGLIRSKLGYWATPYDEAFFLDASGQLREQNAQMAEAQHDYRDALAYNGHYALAQFHLGRLLCRSGRTVEGKQELQAFLREWSAADAAVEEVREARAILAGEV